jgi:PilZ domain
MLPMDESDPSAEEVNLEQRQFPRVSLFQEVACQAGEMVVRTAAADLSLGGMFLDFQSPRFVVGEHVTVRFALGPREPAIVATATVNYVQDGIGVGLCFIELSELDRERIDAFVERALNRKAPKGEFHLRKSARVAVTVPVRVRASPPNGVDIDERTSIITLSKHGACLLTSQPVDIGMKLFLETPNGRAFKSSIVWVGDGMSRSEGQVGVQCRGLAQSLGFQFP